MDAKTEALHQTHSHIHLFLLFHNLPKTASALAKELLKNDTPLITDQLDPRPNEGALLALLKAKVDLNRAKRSSNGKETKKTADVLSDSDDSDDSDNSSDHEQEPSKPAPKAKETKAVTTKAESSDSDSSDESSSDSDSGSRSRSDSDSSDAEEEGKEAEKPTTLVGKVVDKDKVARVVAEEMTVLEKPSTLAKKAETTSDSDDSSDDSSDESSDDKEEEKKAPVKAAAAKAVEGVAPKATSNKRQAAESSSDSDSSSDSSSSDSDSDSDSDSSSSSDSDSDSDSESKAKPTKKKQKVVASPKAPEPVSLPPPTSVTPASVASPKPSAPLANGINGGNKKKERVVNAPFRRVKAEDVTFADPRLKDNSFAARPAGMSDYGAKASADLLVTRGKGFTKEKNKKKRGSYRGGDITMESHSIKFNYDD